MSVERMKLLSVVGKEENMNAFICRYLLETGLQPENALKVFEKGWNLSYFQYDNTAKEVLDACQSLQKDLHITSDQVLSETITIQDSLTTIQSTIHRVTDKVAALQMQMEEKQKIKASIGENAENIKPLANLDLNLKDLYELRYMRFRYGKIPLAYEPKLVAEKQVLDGVAFEVHRDDSYLWLVYVTTQNYSKKVDSFFNLIKFDRIWLPKEIDGKPKAFLAQVEAFFTQTDQEMKALEKQLTDLKTQYETILIRYEEQLRLYTKINYVKRYMAHDDKGNFYIVGWIPTDHLDAILPELKKEDIEYVIKSHDEAATIPPTKLKNHTIFKPFESIVAMYGLPNYTEIDPTIFVAFTAFLMFGFMFGDVGHGAILLLLGILLSLKKVSLGPVLSFGGVASILFGFLYGSVFGKEDIVPQLLIRPMENIQTMLIAGISIGVILILMAMILNVINGIRNHDTSRIFFNTNGIAGLSFYLVVLGSVLAFALTGKLLVPGIVTAIFVVIPLLLIFYQENIMRKIAKTREKEKVSFFEKLFEMFEMLLSFMSNTISFVRLAAFSINHVGLCMAIYILANMVNGAGNLAVSIIGNIVVIVLEGLIVGIQVLRLEYYELFSRFYTGDGRVYEPIQMDHETSQKE